MWHRVVCYKFTNVICDMWTVTQDRNFIVHFNLEVPMFVLYIAFYAFISITWGCIAINAATPRNPHAVIVIKQNAEETFRASCFFPQQKLIFFWRFVTVKHIRTCNWLLLMSFQSQKLWRLTSFQACLHNNVKRLLESSYLSACLYV